MRNGKQCRRRYVKPRDPRTPKQLRLRAAFGCRLESLQRELTEEQRQECRAAGAKIQSRPRLDQSGPLTGQQYHVRRKAAEARAVEPAKASRHKAMRNSCRPRPSRVNARHPACQGPSGEFNVSRPPSQS